MAEENPTRAGLLKLDNPNVKTSYANFSHVHINATDLYLYFGTQSAGGGLENISLENRIIVTHGTFMKMMEYWSIRYSVLNEIYGEVPRSLHDFDQEKVDQAFATFLGTTEPESEENNPDA